VGRIRARCLTVRFPNPPVRTVHATFAAHGSRDRGIYGDFHFARIPPSPWCTACAFPGYLCTVSLSYPSGPSPCMWLSHTPTTMPHLTACRALDISVRVSPAYFHCPYHPFQALPCSSWRTQSRWFRWHVPRGPIHALWLPSTGRE